MADRFAIQNASNGEFHVVLKGVRRKKNLDFFFFFFFSPTLVKKGNNEVIASGETYKTMQGAQAGIVAAQTAAANANRVDKSAAAIADDDAGTFELYNDNSGEVRFRLVGQNGETILHSEGYATTGGALNGIDSVVDHARDFANYVYKTASNGQYYFTLNADNNQVIGVSEMYKSLGGRAVGQYAVETASQGASIVDLTVAQPPTPKPAVFTLLQDALTGQFTFNLVDPKGRELLASDTLYVSKQGAMNGIQSVITNAVTLTQYNNQSLDDGTLFFTLRAGNNQLLGNGPISKTPADRYSNILDVQKYAPIAMIVDGTTAKTRMARFEVFRDAPTGLQYFWRLKSSNGQVILDSPAALASENATLAQIALVKGRAPAVANYKNTTSPTFSFVLTDASGATIGASQTYTRQAPSDSGLESVINNAANATIVIVPWSAPQTLMPTPMPTEAPTPLPGSACSTYAVCNQCKSVTGAVDGPCHWCATSATAITGSCSPAATACTAGSVEVLAAGVCPTEAPTPEPTLAPTPSPLVGTETVVTQTVSVGDSADQQSQSHGSSGNMIVVATSAFALLAVAMFV